MNEAHTGASTRGAISHEGGNAAALGAADWLCLAAAPTFAIMALLTGVLGGGQRAMMCSTAQDGSPLSGMVPMYLLMSVFHLAPWLKLISARRSGVHRSSPDSETVTEVGAVVRSITEKHTATKAKRASGA